MAHDIFPHHDRVIDQDADRQRQGQQGQEIQREAKRIQGNERREHRNRQSQPGDDGRAPGMQEQEHDQDGQQCAFQNRVFDVVHPVLDEDRAIFRDVQVDVRRQAFLDVIDLPANRFGHFDGVGPARLADLERDHAFAVLG